MHPPQMSFGLEFLTYVDNQPWTLLSLGSAVCRFHTSSCCLLLLSLAWLVLSFCSSPVVGGWLLTKAVCFFCSLVATQLFVLVTNLPTKHIMMRSLYKFKFAPKLSVKQFFRVPIKKFDTWLHLFTQPAYPIYLFDMQSLIWNQKK